MSSPIRNWMSCLVRFGEINAMSRISVLPLLCPDGCVHHCLNKSGLDDFECFLALDQSCFSWHSRKLPTSY